MPNHRLEADAWSLAAGMATTWIQILLLREAMVAAGGNELCLSLSFGFWLLGVTVGAAMAGRLTYRKPDVYPPILGMLLVLSALSGLLVLRTGRSLAGMDPGALPSLADSSLLAFLCMFPAGLFIGALFPALGGVQVSAKGSVLRLYLLEALGSLAAGALFTLVLAGRVGAVFLLGLCSLTLAVPIGLRRTLKGKAIQTLTGLACVVIGIAFMTPRIGGRLDQSLLDLAWSQAGSRGKVAARRDTRYERLELGRNQTQFDLYANGRYQWSLPDLFGRRPLVHLALYEHPSPHRCLIIGCEPADDLPAALSHRLDRVGCSTLDPDLLPFLLPFFDRPTRDLLKDRRVALTAGDGRRYLLEVEPSSVDVLAVFTPRPETLSANRYYTAEFFELARRVVGAKGVVALSLPGGGNLLAPETATLIRSVLRAARGPFPFRALSAGTEVKVFLSPARGQVTEDREELRKRWQAQGPTDPSFTGHHFALYFEPDAIERLKRQITAAGALPNTDDQPTAFTSGLAASLRMSQRDVTQGPLFSGRIDRQWLLLLLVPLLVPLVVSGLRPALLKPMRTAALTAILATGGSGMALEVVLLYAFQAASGNLFQAIGILVAIFMAGLALGSLLGGAAVRKLSLFSACLAAEGVMLAVLVLSPLLLWWAAQSVVLCGMLMLAAGAATGFGFGPFLRTASGDAGAEAASAGAVDAADNLGGALGASLVGIVLVPLLGVRLSCAGLAMAKLCTLAGVIALFRRSRS